MADDLAIYIDKDQGILHIARVLELRAGIAPWGRPLPWLLSKWGDLSGEVCHFAHDHPLGASGFQTSIQYWTDRPLSG